LHQLQHERLKYHVDHAYVEDALQRNKTKAPHCAFTPNDRSVSNAAGRILAKTFVADIFVTPHVQNSLQWDGYALVVATGKPIKPFTISQRVPCRGSQRNL